MHARIGSSCSILKRVSELVAKPYLNSTREVSAGFSSSSSCGSKNGEDEWNDAWEAAWLPEDLTPKARAPWESDVNFPLEESTTVLSADVDAETKAFVEDMNDNWNERPKGSKAQQQENLREGGNGAVYRDENMKKDYRLKKQRIHASLWTKEIEKMKPNWGIPLWVVETILRHCSIAAPSMPFSLSLSLSSVWQLFDEMQRKFVNSIVDSGLRIFVSNFMLAKF